MKPKLEQGTLCTINKSYGRYSSGTLVQVIDDPNTSGNNHGYVYVRVIADGELIDIEYDYLTIRRPRQSAVGRPTREERRRELAMLKDLPTL